MHLVLKQIRVSGDKTTRVADILYIKIKCCDYCRIVYSKCVEYKYETVYHLKS